MIERLKAKSELLLYQLAWGMDSISQPAWRCLDGSFETWAYRRGLLWQIHRLEACGFVESRRSSKSLKRVHRLTKAGRLRALGGRDPVERWKRSWDGKWRFVLFDIPETKRALRRELRLKLREEQFGCLQKSVWISPDPLQALRKEIGTLLVDAGTFAAFEGNSCAGETCTDIVGTAWDFKTIGRRWNALQQHLDNVPGEKSGPDRSELLKWCTEEYVLWKECMDIDPLLPEVLLPESYPGRKVWTNRVNVLTSLSKRLTKGQKIGI